MLILKKFTTEKPEGINNVTFIHLPFGLMGQIQIFSLLSINKLFLRYKK